MMDRPFKIATLAAHLWNKYPGGDDIVQWATNTAGCQLLAGWTQAYGFIVTTIEHVVSLRRSRPTGLLSNHQNNNEAE